MSGKYSDLIRKAREPENQKPGLEPIQDVAPPPEPEQEVNLCVKVPISWRRHWAAESKKQGITMTAVIIEALESKFGKP